MSPESLLQELPLVAILRGLEPARAVEVGNAIFDAGIRAIEVPLGAVLFMISDSLISLEKFLWSAALIGPLVWITYALAQLLITRGMLARR